MAVRIDGAADYVRRTASLPANSSFTWMFDCIVLSDQGSATLQALCGATSAGFTEGYGVYWESNAADGVMRLFATGAGDADVSFSSRPEVQRPFCMYVRCSGTGAGQFTAGWRYHDGPWVRASHVLGAAVDVAARLEFGGIGSTYYTNCRLQNIKVWNVALPEAEIEIESRSAALVARRGINYYLPLPHSGDTKDRGPYARNPTIGGTLTTEYFDFKRPSKVRRPPVPYEAVASTTFQILAGPRFSLAGAHGLAGD